MQTVSRLTLRLMNKTQQLIKQILSEADRVKTRAEQLTESADVLIGIAEKLAQEAGFDPYEVTEF